MQNTVIDTNVIVSAALTPQGNSAKIIKVILGGESFRLYYSSDILREYEDILSRQSLKISVQTQNEIIGSIKECGILITPLKSTVPFPDESDRIFYDAAKESGAILVTGNVKHYPEEGFIVTPAEFLRIYNK